MWQTVPANEKIDPKSYLPGRNAANNTVEEISQSHREKFVSDLQHRIIYY